MTKTKKDNKKAHFNVIDAVIIVLVISVALSIFFRAYIVEKLWAQTQTDDYVITFSIEDIRHTTPTYMNVGDDVRFADTGVLLGTLISESDNANALNIAPASKYFPDANGNVIEVFYPDAETRINAKGRIQCRGYYGEDGGFSVDGRHFLAPGQSINVTTELVSVTLNIMSIEPLAE